MAGTDRQGLESQCILTTTPVAKKCYRDGSLVQMLAAHDGLNKVRIETTPGSFPLS